jgi:hypothetical protein
MSEAKFTAGPWQREDYSDEDGVLFEMELAGANGEAICRIDFEGVDNTAYAEADARLIAAAPTMYDALKKIRARLRFASSGGAKAKPTIAQLNEMLDEACFALRRAEGAQ